MNFKGKRASLLVVTLGLATLAVVAFLSREAFLEKWREHGISSEHPPVVTRLNPEDEVWWQQPSGTFDIGFEENLRLSRILETMARLRILGRRIVLHPEETDYAVSGGIHQETVWHELVRSLLEAATIAAGERFVLSVPEAGASVIGSETRLRTGMYIDFIDVSDLLNASVPVGFPLLGRTVNRNENSLLGLIAIRTGWSTRWNGRQGLLAHEGTLVVWADESLHGDVRRVLEELRSEVRENGGQSHSGTAGPTE